MEDRLRTLGSHSYLAVMSAAEADAVLSAERAELLAQFPDGALVEPFVVDVTVGRPAARE
ncbi:methyltransferase [Streptomyces hygroscopicus]|nr:methyltransferase [Streptomyces hygroscopicus]